MRVSDNSEIFFSYFLKKTYVVTLNRTISDCLMLGHNMFLLKKYGKLSPNHPLSFYYLEHCHTKLVVVFHKNALLW